MKEYIMRYENEVLQLLPDKIQPLVRCKDCKHRFDGEHMANCCEELMIMTGWLTEIPDDPNGFCSKGERKDGDGNG